MPAILSRQEHHRAVRGEQLHHVLRAVEINVVAIGPVQATNGIDVLELPDATLQRREPRLEIGHIIPRISCCAYNANKRYETKREGNAMDWKGKTALITGGVSGIGFGIARAFSRAGIELVLTYRNAQYRSQAERWFRDNARPVPRFVALDVTDRARWAELADEVGPIHILINNAGVSVFGPTDAANYADYDWI